MTRWGRQVGGFGDGGQDRYMLAADEAVEGFNENKILYGDQINVQLNCAMHYGAGADYAIFSDFDEYPVLHPEADTFKPTGLQKDMQTIEKSWSLGIKTNTAAASWADWLDKQPRKFNSFNFCAGMMVGPKHSFHPDGRWFIPPGSPLLHPKSTAVLFTYDWRADRCHTRGPTMDKWVARAPLETVMEPSIHTMEQSWSTKRRWYKFPKRPGMLMVPSGVAHFRHFKSWISRNFDKATKQWTPLNAGLGITCVEDKVTWAYDILKPWFAENNHFSKAAGQCVFGAGADETPTGRRTKTGRP